MNPGLIGELLGHKVAIFTAGTQSGFKDEGVLEAFDGQILRLRKGADCYYFPLFHIRLIRLLD
ncbi:MAG: hypothetical protein KIS66_07900 [Fimbriimonadaceae bacterium]|nr:hypothetical protein [Fimbriimonadaceae bacterium]